MKKLIIILLVLIFSSCSTMKNIGKEVSNCSVYVGVQDMYNYSNYSYINTNYWVTIITNSKVRNNKVEVKIPYKN